jgi:hypothetical protein
MPESVAARHAEQLREQGFTVLEALLGVAQVEPHASVMDELWQRVGRPTLYAREDRVLEPDVRVNPVGMTCAGILERIPALADLLLEPRLLAVLEALLGPSFELELGTGVLSDRSRGFFFWHHHAGGIDAEDVRALQVYPHHDRVQRLGCTLYASPLDEANGVMLVAPRRFDAPTAPPHPPGTEPWPGAVQVRAPAGSVIMFDEGTWHAVTPMTVPGRRAFFGFFVRRSGLEPTKRQDPSIATALARNPALARAYGGPR